MKLANLKNTGDGDEIAYAPCPIEAYGYGLRLYLDDDTCEKLGIASAMKPGTQVKLQAMAIVVSSGSELERDGTGVACSVQITDMGLETAGTVRNAAQVLYGED